MSLAVIWHPRLSNLKSRRRRCLGVVMKCRGLRALTSAHESKEEERNRIESIPKGTVAASCLARGHARGTVASIIGAIREPKVDQKCLTTLSTMSLVFQKAGGYMFLGRVQALSHLVPI